MLCDNCGKKEANVRYSENINGRRKELNLCEECSQKLGIANMEFSMPIDFSSFFGGFMEEFSRPEFMPLLQEVKELKCNQCGYTFNDIANSGRLGCENCYDVFEERLDPIIRKIQGANHHIGRTGKVIDNKIEEKISNTKNKKENNKGNNKENNHKKTNDKNIKLNKLEELQEKLKEVIKEEKYEEAAKIRDEIKKIEKEG